MTVDVAPNTITFFADLACPWAHLAAHRLHSARSRLGLDHLVRVDVRAFPIELLNEAPTPKPIVDAEIPVAGALEPRAGWQMWQRPAHDYPVTLLLAMEAVEAAKHQGAEASETLDRRLRFALFGQSRNIAMRHEVLAVAQESPGVDPTALAAELAAGTARPALEEHLAAARTETVRGSPHLFLPDGTGAHNPGITMRWEGDPGEGFPVVTEDAPEVYDDLLQRAAS